MRMINTPTLHFKIGIIILLMPCFIACDEQIINDPCSSEEYIKVKNEIPDQFLTLGEDTLRRDLNEPPVVFEVEDEKMGYAVRLNDNQLNIVDVKMIYQEPDKKILKVTPSEEGTAMVKITAVNNCDRKSTTFEATVVDKEG